MREFRLDFPNLFFKHLYHHLSPLKTGWYPGFLGDTVQLVRTFAKKIVILVSFTFLGPGAYLNHDLSVEISDLHGGHFGFSSLRLSYLPLRCHLPA